LMSHNHLAFRAIGAHAAGERSKVRSPRAGRPEESLLIPLSRTRRPQTNSPGLSPLRPEEWHNGTYLGRMGEQNASA
jgi:hypothetical protein